MARKKRKEKWVKNPKMEEFEDHRPLSQRFMRGLIPFAVLLLVLYAAVHLLSRTEGCRVLVSEKIEEYIGQPVSIGHMWTDGSLDLHAAGLRTEGGFRHALPGLEVEEIVVRWTWPRGILRRPSVRQIDVTGMKLSLVLDRDHRWQPQVFSPLATWLVRWGRLSVPQDAGDDPAESREAGRKAGAKSKEKDGAKDGSSSVSFWESITVDLQNSEVRWWNVDGTEAASAIGIRLQAIPLTVPQRDLHHYVVGIDRVRTALGEQVEDLTFELITTMGHHIVLGFKANWVSGASRSVKRESRHEPAPVAEPEALHAVAPVPMPSPQEPEPSEPQPREEDRRSAEELADYFRDMLEGALISD